MIQPKFWDLGRFVRTLTYFDIIPVISDIDWLKNLILGEDIQQVENNPKIKTGVILVAGATGGVGKRVVKRLQKDNYPVKALVRSIPRAKTILGENLEFYEADLTIPDTLKPDLMQDAIAIICCTGTRIQPVGGDTPNRDKYYQGVKFYQPEIAESTPEAVEYKGIQNLVNLAIQYLAKADEKILFDFTQPTPDLKSSWGAVDDVVMGGVSESGIRLAGNVAIFSGNVSTENNGGFASVRNRNFQPPLDLSSYTGIELRVKGDGKRYKFIMRCENNWDGISYCYSFDTVKDEWITVRIPFKDLIAVFRAKTVPDAPAFAASKTYSVQLMLSKFEYDRGLNPTFEPGYFQLDVESIKAYKDEPTPQFIMVSSAGVTRPGRSDLNLEEEPPAVRMNDMLGGILTWKLKGEDVVRNSGLTYTIIRPCALTEEVGGKVLTFAEGDNIKGQVSREDIAELCIQSMKIPAACEKTFEVKEEAASGKIDWESLFGSVSRDR